MSLKYYIYILQSIDTPQKYYVGYTTNLSRRIFEHNNKSQIYSKRYAPWKLITKIVFSDLELAEKFEKYLKTPSGKAFMKKRLI